jgi:SOS response regulatory protein OraA/RecX
VAPPNPDALTQLTRLLASTDKTRAQLLDALASRGYGQAEIDGAIERAQALGYLDDSRVAQRKARSALQAGWAGEALVARLLNVGLAEDAARSAIKDAIAEAGWNALDAARTLVVARKLAGAKGARFLASRGFEDDVVERVIGSGGHER